MKLTIYIVDANKSYEDSSAKEIAAWAQTHGFKVEHKIEAMSGQDNKANLIDELTMKFLVMGIAFDSLMDEDGMDPITPSDHAVAFEYNGKWGKL